MTKMNVLQDTLGAQIKETQRQLTAAVRLQKTGVVKTERLKDYYEGKLKGVQYALTMLQLVNQ
jgi:hypothetical protein